MLITALIGWFAAQVLKMILVWDKKKFDFKRIIGSGGMPSSHSSFVMALTMSIGFTQGFDSVAFAISAVMSFVVMYDAAGVRRSAGQQAAILNKLVESVMNADFFKNRKTSERTFWDILRLKFLPGAILGVIIAIIRYV